MPTETIQTNEPAATQEIGERLAATLGPDDLVTLSGPLGAGKTTLVQGLARGLNVATNPTSPTFVLIIEHEGSVPLLHLDAYRLESKCYDAIRDAGVVDFLDRTDAVKLVEWPEFVADFLPTPTVTITIEYGEGDSERVIRIDRP